MGTASGTQGNGKYSDQNELWMEEDRDRAVKVALSPKVLRNSRMDDMEDPEEKTYSS